MKTKSDSKLPDASRYAINIVWSDEDEGFLATVPAIPGCICVMPTEQAALKEIRTLIRTCLELFAEDGNPIPEPDAVEMEETRHVLPLLNLSELARAAGVNRATLASRVRRSGNNFKPNAAVAKRLADKLVAA